MLLLLENVCFFIQVTSCVSFEATITIRLLKEWKSHAKIGVEILHPKNLHEIPWYVILFLCIAFFGFKLMDYINIISSKFYKVVALPILFEHAETMEDNTERFAGCPKVLILYICKSRKHNIIHLKSPCPLL